MMASIDPQHVQDNTHARKPGALRVVIEGCGHGTLDAIYASVEKSCEIKGWDGVDLVIICGDFQAVRDQLDLNVTAMPAKYREMADFHQYYWGTKTAPFLTIFVGGNHEASNHLWELYYGGWVAPNIYYLGAANVIDVGPLKIAALSGIWKGYDFRKPHYERLPYSHDDMYSIYHVRELDVRKLLTYRGSQVDIGISHDWPKGIEWLGNHQRLFRHKSHLQEDAENGRLGSVAADQVLNRLRPQYWFSAHLHTRYTAVKNFDLHKQHPAALPQSEALESSDASMTEKDPAPASLKETSNQQRLSAWNDFHLTARESEAKETAQALERQRERREISERTGVPLVSANVYNETYKKVKLGEGFSRAVTSISETSNTLQEPQRKPDNSVKGIPQLDGNCVSSPGKRRRPSSPNHTGRTGTATFAYAPIRNSEPQDQSVSNGLSINPDAIDLDLSDEDDSDLTKMKESEDAHQSEATPLLAAEARSSTSSPFLEEAVGMPLVPLRPFKEPKAVWDLAPQLDDQQPRVDPKTSSPSMQDESASTTVAEGTDSVDTSDEVSREMRARLAALSTKFVEPEKVEISPALPHPEAIDNTMTKFLALSKCTPGQHFLQLMEISPYKGSDKHHDDKSPVRLRYDPEWLAILRVFAPELTLGGSPAHRVPVHRGDTYYQDRYREEYEWIDEHVVKTEKLDVPYNFEITLSRDEASTGATEHDMPLEATNAQTTRFCELVGIENKFDFSEDDREQRRKAGPAPSRRDDRAASSNRGGRGGHGRDGQGQGQGHGRGRGRGRGRGSGFRGHGRGRGGRHG